MKKDYNRILDTLLSLQKEFPKQTIGVHIATALSEHDIFNISDKAFLEAINDYYTELIAIDVPHNNDDIEDIIQSGMNLTIDEDEEYED